MIVFPIPGLTPEENKVLNDNLAQLTDKRPRAVMRSRYYNTKRILQEVGFSVPPSMRNLNAVLGWPTKAVDGLSGRLHLNGFVLPKQSGIHEDLDLIFAKNRMAIEWPATQVSTFTHGCSFVAVTPGDTDEGEPETLILSMAATESTGIWDVRKRQLTSALWIPDCDQQISKQFVLFMKDHTVSGRRDNVGPWEIKRTPNILPRLPVTPVTYRGQLGRPFGMSRLSASVMYLCQMAARTLLRTEVSAEFFNAPQRYAMGATAEDFQNENGEAVTAWETILGNVWLIGRDEEGNIPTVGQFPQSSPQPNVEMMRMITTLFAGETALPVSSLGIIHDNPASAAAIDAAWADMVQLAELCQTELGQAAVEIAQNALMTQDKKTTLPDELVKLRPKWRDAATPTKSAMADAITKQVAAGILLPHSVVALEGMGYDEVDIQRIQAEHEKAKAEEKAAIAALGGPLNGVVANPGAAPGKPALGAKPSPAVGSGVAPARSAPPR